MLPNIILVRLAQYVSEMIEDHQYGFCRKRCTKDQIFYIRQVVDKNGVFNGSVNQLFIDFKKACGSVEREVLYDILLEFYITKKPVRLIQMYLNGPYSNIRVSKFYMINFLFRMG
jgi:hypothetical protein